MMMILYQRFHKICISLIDHFAPIGRKNSGGPEATRALWSPAASPRATSSYRASVQVLHMQPCATRTTYQGLFVAQATIFQSRFPHCEDSNRGES